MGRGRGIGPLPQGHCLNGKQSYSYTYGVANPPRHSNSTALTPPTIQPGRAGQVLPLLEGYLVDSKFPSFIRTVLPALNPHNTEQHDAHPPKHPTRACGPGAAAAGVAAGLAMPDGECWAWAKATLHPHRRCCRCWRATWWTPTCARSRRRRGRSRGCRLGRPGLRVGLEGSTRPGFESPGACGVF